MDRGPESVGLASERLVVGHLELQHVAATVGRRSDEELLASDRDRPPPRRILAHRRYQTTPVFSVGALKGDM